MIWLNSVVNKSLRIPRGLLRIPRRLLRIPRRLLRIPRGLTRLPIMLNFRIPRRLTRLPIMLNYNKAIHVLQTQDKKKRKMIIAFIYIHNLNTHYFHFYNINGDRWGPEELNEQGMAWFLSCVRGADFYTLDNEFCYTCARQSPFTVVQN